jgi:pimeloyl-ACP methyl ester carboxylesterase
MRTVSHLVPNGDGWLLSLVQSWDPATLDPSRRPVLIVPGYGMNSFIFGYHPRGTSLEGFLVEQGFEVWRVDLRASGGSIRRGGGEGFSLEDLALTDLSVAIDGALDRTRTQASRVDLIGASLGGTLMFIHAVAKPANRLGALVSMGSPVRWVEAHPLVKLLFSSPVLVGLVPVRGTRWAAELALPLLARHTPSLLGIYLNPAASDVAAAREMVRTVEDPSRFINRQIARWIRDRDLVVHGINVSEALARITLPTLCVAANGDGIVPLATAQFPYERVGASEKGLLVVGDDQLSMAHADLFVANQAHETVFRPIADWLSRQSTAAIPA